MINLRGHFDNKEHAAQLVRRAQRDWFIKARHNRERREKTAEKHEDDLAAFAVEYVMATEAQLQAFELRLDQYDAATVAALLENQERLDAVNLEIELMLQQAYVMEDGRRVFKTEDGTKVFDEYGVEVGRDELDPALIDDQRPSWEAYKDRIDYKDELTSEREELLDYQSRLDSARDQISEGEISEADLKALDADLLDAMPSAVRRQIPDLHQPQPTPKTPAPTVFSPENPAPQIDVPPSLG